MESKELEQRLIYPGQAECCPSVASAVPGLTLRATSVTVSRDHQDKAASEATLSQALVGPVCGRTDLQHNRDPAQSSRRLAYLWQRPGAHRLFSRSAQRPTLRAKMENADAPQRSFPTGGRWRTRLCLRWLLFFGDVASRARRERRHGRVDEQP